MGDTTTRRTLRAAARRFGLPVLLAGLVAPLTGCSVPREADFPAGAAGAATAKAAPSATPPSVVDAAGSSVASPSPSASPTPTPSPAASPALARVKQPTPATVPGYTLSRAGSVANPLAGVKGASGVFGAMTTRSVAKGTTRVGLLFLFAVRPEYASDPAVAKVVLSRVTTGISRGGAPVRMQTFGRQPVGVASSAKTGTIVVWLAKSVLAVVVGVDPALVTGYARAYIAAR